MSIRGSSTALAVRVKTAGALSLLLCLFTLAGTGCMRRMPLDKRSFFLTGTAEFPIMAPANSPVTPGNDYEQYRLELAGREAPTNPRRAVDCTIKGSVFSLGPAESPNPRLWVITSLNPQGWARRSDSIDVQAEWMRLGREVLALGRSGCFPSDQSPEEILRQIAEAIPVPASEELFLNYSLGRSGFVDLVPGMQLVIERAAFVNGAGVRVPVSGTDEFSETLGVVRRPAGGSALRLVGVVSCGLGKAVEKEADSPRSVTRRFGASSELRLMLLNLNEDNRRRFPVLLGSTDTLELWNASARIVDGTMTECPPRSSSGLGCLFLGKDSAVSVLMTVWMNGRRTYISLGATVGSQLGRLPESERTQALATVSLERPLVGGGYARVEFPHDPESARNVILLNEDRLAWRR
jgi:hypothetical protein